MAVVDDLALAGAADPRRRRPQRALQRDRRPGRGAAQAGRDVRAARSSPTRSTASCCTRSWLEAFERRPTSSTATCAGGVERGRPFLGRRRPGGEASRGRGSRPRTAATPSLRAACRPALGRHGTCLRPREGGNGAHRSRTISATRSAPSCDTGRSRAPRSSAWRSESASRPPCSAASTRGSSVRFPIRGRIAWSGCGRPSLREGTGPAARTVFRARTTWTGASAAARSRASAPTTAPS